jgi:bifunctional non-homologous end joining protein LigD
MGRASTLPKRFQPMLATLTDGPFDDPGWIFEDKYDGFRMVAKIESGKVTLYSRNGQVISRNYIEVASALEGVKGDAVIDGELVALDENGISHFQFLQNALRRKAKLLYCAFDLMFQDGEDLRPLPLIERKKRLKAVLPKHRLIAFSRHRKAFGTKFFEEAGIVEPSPGVTLRQEFVRKVADLIPTGAAAASISMCTSTSSVTPRQVFRGGISA